MKKQDFKKLDRINKRNALSKMVDIRRNSNWPESKQWKKISDISYDIDNGYNPDTHFSFYVDIASDGSQGDVSVKIG